MSEESGLITHIILACDESGSKGFANRDEKTPGEVGVFAGIMVPAADLNSVQPAFDAIAKRYVVPEGKLHISDMQPVRQEALRNEIFTLVREHRLPCFFEAIHVAGFHRAHNRLQTLLEQGRRARRSSIKVSGSPPTPDSLYVALFQGLYGKILAFCMERKRTRLHIEVRTDRVDLPIMRNFEKTAREFLNFETKIKRVTGFDPKTKTVVEGTIKFEAVPANLRLPITVEHLELEVAAETDGLVVAADVLANSLAHLFTNRPAEERFRALNTPEAFARHPLAQCLDTFTNWGGYNFTDSFYAHPRDPARRSN